MNEQQESTQETAPENFEQAMPFEVEQRAALFGLCHGLLDLGNPDNKKFIKKLSKQLKREVVGMIGSNGASDILEGNKRAVLNVVRTIHNTQIESAAKRRLRKSTHDTWRDSINKGVASLYG